MAGISRREAIVNLVKGFLGGGFLTIPFASAQVGLVVATFGLIVVALVNALGVARYVQCEVVDTDETCDGNKEPDPPEVEDGSEEEENEDEEDEETTRTEERAEGKQSSSSGAEVWGLGHASEACNRALGKPGVVVLAASVLMAQVGSLIAYTVAMMETLDAAIGLDRRVALCLLVVCYSGLSMVRNMQDVAVVSTVAILVYAVIVALLVQDGWQQLAASGPAPGILSARLGIGKWLGMTIWAFEGCNTAVFVYRSMALHEGPGPKGGGDRLRPFWEALCIAYLFGFVLYAFITIFGLSAYGLRVKELVYFSFTSSSAVRVAELALCVILTLSFPIQAVPPISFLDATLPSVPRVLRRLGLVGCIAAGSIFVPSVNSITALTGSLGFGFSGFVLPALCHWRIARPLAKGQYLESAMDLLLLGFGVFAIASGIRDALT